MIQVQDLTKKFKDRTVLDNVNFQIGEGEIFGYLGPNGAGKTTTMRIILGLIRPTAGKALVWGRNLGEQDDIRSKVGVLFEHDGLYEGMSGYDNLDYYSHLYSVPNRKMKIEHLLEFCGLSDRKNDKVGTYSKGMKRKLALARTIIHEPRVLFLDEPSSGLDPEAQVMVRDLIIRLSNKEGITIFLNSHDLDEVQRICSKIAILQRGIIKAYDTTDNLRRKSAKPMVEIALSDDTEVEKSLSLISHLDYIVKCERCDDRLSVTLNKSEASSKLLSSLVAEGIAVQEVKRVTKSIEDIYLEVTHNEK